MPLEGESKAEYNRRYYRENREALRLVLRENHLKHHDERLKKMEQANRKKGATKREKGPKAAMVVKVSKVRRYTIIMDRCYFNKETGFTQDQLEEIITKMNAPKVQKVGRRG